MGDDNRRQDQESQDRDLSEASKGSGMEDVEMVGPEDEDYNVRALILSGVPRNITVESREQSTILKATYRTPTGEDVELGWDVEEGETDDVYRRFNVDLACILYRVLQCIGSYHGPLDDLLRRPISGEIELEVNEVPVDDEGYYDLDMDLSGGGRKMVEMKARDRHGEHGEVRNSYIRFGPSSTT